METSIQELIRQYAQTGERQCMVSIVDELQHREKLWVAYSPVSKNHYMEYQNDIPTAFLFSDPDYCEAFREHLASKKIRIDTLEISQSGRVTMFSDFFRNGIEQVMIDNGQTYIIVGMKDIIKQPDFSSLPENERPLLNRTLMKNASYFFQSLGMDEIDPDCEENFMREIFRSRYLLPLVFDDNAPEGLSVRRMKIGGAVIRMAVIRRKNGSCVIPVFTDWVELGKCDREKVCTGNIVGFDDLEKLCSHGEVISINPLGFNMLMDKSTAASIRSRFGDTAADRSETDRTAESLPAPAQTSPEPPSDVTVQTAAAAPVRNDPAKTSAAPAPEFFEPHSVPEPMMTKLTQLLDVTHGIRSVYLKGMKKNGKTSYLIIVDFEGTDPSVFGGMARQVGPLTGGLGLSFVSLKSKTGRAAVSGAKPFYVRP